MAETLQIVINAKDNASGPIRGVNKSLGKLGGAAKMAAKIGIAGFAALGVGAIAFGAKAVSMGSDVEEMMGKFNVVFGKESGRVVESLDAMGAAVGRSKFELREMASGVQDMFVPLGYARNVAADMSLALTELAVDVGSFNNVADTEVMERFKSALVGNHEAVRSFGIVITETTLKEELARMGMEDLTGAALEQAKVQARLNLIYAGTADAHGDAERTAGSWANTMRGLKATLSDTTAEIGTKLLPILTPLLQSLSDLAVRYAPMAIAAFEGMIEAISNIFAVLQGGDVTDIFAMLGLSPEMLATVQAALAQLMNFFQPTIDRLIAAWPEMIAGMEPLGGKFKALWEAVQPIAELLGVVLIGAINLLMEAWAAVMPNLGTILGSVIDYIIAYVNMLVGVFRGMVDFVSALIKGNWSGAWDAASGIVKTIIAGIINAFNSLVPALQVVFDSVIVAIDNWLGNIDKGAQSKFREIVQALKDTWAQLIDFFAPTIERLKDGFAGMIEGMAPLGDKMGSLGDAFANLWEAIQPIVELLGVVLIAAINLLMEVWAAVMPNLGTILGSAIEYITSLVNMLAGILRGLIDLVVALITGDWAGAWDAAKGIVSAYIEGVTGMFGALKDYYVAIFDSLKTAVGNWVSNLAEQSPAVAAAVDTMSAIWNDTFLPAITAVSDFFTGTVFPTFDALVEWFTGAGTTAIEGTSSLWNDTLLPAFTAVSDFLNDYVIPVIQVLHEIQLELLRIAVEALTYVWTEQLKPALDMIWAFIKDNLSPIFETLSKMISETLTKALNGLKSLLNGAIKKVFDTTKGKIDKISGAFGGISSAISTVIGWLQKVKNKLASISIPAWIKQSSPSPIEQAFLDLGTAIDFIAARALPTFVAALSGVDLSKIKEIARAISDLTKATSGLMYFAIDLSGFVLPDTDYQSVIDWLVDFGKRIAEAVNAIDIEFADDFKAFAANLKAAFGPLMDAIKFVNALGKTDWLEPGTIPDFVPWLASITGQVAQAVTRLRNWEGMDFGEEFKTFAANLKAGFAPLIEAAKFVEALRDIAWLEPGTIPSFVPWLASITGQVAQAVTWLRNWDRMNFGEEFKEFTANLKAAFGPLNEAIDFVNKLANIEMPARGVVPKLIPWLASVAGQVAQAVTWLRKWGRMDFGEDFKEFADNLKAAFGPLKAAVDFVKELIDFAPPTVHVTAVIDWLGRMAGDVGDAVTSLRNSGRLNFSEDFIAFADNLQAAFGPMIDALDLMKELPGYIPPARRLIRRFVGDAVFMFKEFQRMIATEFSDEAAAVSNNVSEAIGNMASGMSGMFDLFLKLSDSGTSSYAMGERFKTNLQQVIKAIDVTLNAFKVYVTQRAGNEWIPTANEFYEAMGTVLGLIGDGMSLFDIMNTVKIPSAARITAVVDALMQMVREMSRQMREIGNDLGNDLLYGIGESLGGDFGGKRLSTASTYTATIRHEVTVNVSSPDFTVSSAMIDELADALVERIDLNG